MKIKIVLAGNKQQFDFWVREYSGREPDVKFIYGNTPDSILQVKDAEDIIFVGTFGEKDEDYKLEKLAISRVK